MLHGRCATAPRLTRAPPQLLSGRELFPGAEEKGELQTDQLRRLAATFGAPTPAAWPGVADLPLYAKAVAALRGHPSGNIPLARVRGGGAALSQRSCVLTHGAAQKLPSHTSPQARDLLMCMLTLGSCRRRSRPAAGAHPARRPGEAHHCGGGAVARVLSGRGAAARSRARARACALG